MGFILPAAFLILAIGYMIFILRAANLYPPAVWGFWPHEHRSPPFCMVSQSRSEKAVKAFARIAKSELTLTQAMTLLQNAYKTEIKVAA